MSRHTLNAGAAATDISPRSPQHLSGYPFVERISTGVHDPLLASALVLENGDTTVAFCSLDLLFVTKAQTATIRQRVEEQSGIPANNIVVAATHTHSAPDVCRFVHAEDDPTAVEPDAAYLDLVLNGAVEAVLRAWKDRVPAEIALVTADGTGIGGNRRAGDGAIDPEIPLLLVRTKSSRRMLALLLAYCMHPTVLHEDSTYCSGDFPGLARQHLKHDLQDDLVVVYHTGPAGNQSPRHFVTGNTMDEADRLGRLLAERIRKALLAVDDHAFSTDVPLNVARDEAVLQRRAFPPAAEASQKREQARARLQTMRQRGDDPRQVRTAECDWFGACEFETLCRLAGSGQLDRALECVLPAEVQVIGVGPWCLVALPGEFFVEYSLEIKKRAAMRSFVLGLCNGELQGYVVTRQAYAEGGYEASNSLFGPEAGTLLVDRAVQLVERVAGGFANA